MNSIKGNARDNLSYYDQNKVIAELAVVWILAKSRSFKTNSDTLKTKAHGTVEGNDILKQTAKINTNAEWGWAAFNF